MRGGMGVDGMGCRCRVVVCGLLCCGLRTLGSGWCCTHKTHRLDCPCYVLGRVVGLSGLCSGGRGEKTGIRSGGKRESVGECDGASITLQLLHLRFVFFLSTRRGGGTKASSKIWRFFWETDVFFSLSLTVSLLVWSGKRVRFDWLDVQKMCYVGGIVLCFGARD